MVGHDAIAAAVTWPPETYQLTWTPEGVRGSCGGHGVHLGALPGRIQGRSGQRGEDDGPVHDGVEKAAGRAWKVDRTPAMRVPRRTVAG